MWFGSPDDSNTGGTGRAGQFSAVSDRGQETIQSIINSTTCFDLMRNSSKIVLFETTIPFHLAFLALVEHDIDVAPLWDGVKGGFVALMTTSDFAHAVKRSYDGGGSPNILRCTVADMLSAAGEQYFLHPDFNSIDAEDSVHQLCASLSRYESEYIPVMDPDEGSLVAILGYLDILYLLMQMIDRFPLMFSTTVESALLPFIRSVPTVPRSTCLSDVYDIIEDREVKCVAVAAASGRVGGLYQVSDADFMSSIVSDTLLETFREKTIGDAIDFKNDLSGDNPTPRFCTLNDTIKNVVEQMVLARSTKLLCMDNAGESLGIITVRSIVSYIFDGDVNLY